MEVDETRRLKDTDQRPLKKILLSTLEMKMEMGIGCRVRQLQSTKNTREATILMTVVVRTDLGQSHPVTDALSPQHVGVVV